MKIEDLHAYHEELARKLEMTSSLLQSKMSSAAKPMRSIDRQPHFESVALMPVQSRIAVIANCISWMQARKRSSSRKLNSSTKST